MPSSAPLRIFPAYPQAVVVCAAHVLRMAVQVDLGYAVEGEGAEDRGSEGRGPIGAESQGE